MKNHHNKFNKHYQSNSKQRNENPKIFKNILKAKKQRSFNDNSEFRLCFFSQRKERNELKKKKKKRINTTILFNI